MLTLTVEKPAAGEDRRVYLTFPDGSVGAVTFLANKGRRSALLGFDLPPGVRVERAAIASPETLKAFAEKKRRRDLTPNR